MRKGDTALALIAAPITLAIAAWFDTSVYATAYVRGRSTFDSSGMSTAQAAGAFLIAGAVLLLAVLAWRSRSRLVGILYALVGGFFATLFWMVMVLGTTHNDIPSVLPEPIAIALSQVLLATLGLLNADAVIGAGMAIAGVAVLVRSNARTAQRLSRGTAASGAYASGTRRSPGSARPARSPRDPTSGGRTLGIPRRQRWPRPMPSRGPSQARR